MRKLSFEFRTEAVNAGLWELGVVYELGSLTPHILCPFHCPGGCPKASVSIAYAKSPRLHHRNR